jgi:hypothetical protein
VPTGHFASGAASGALATTIISRSDSKRHNPAASADTHRRISSATAPKTSTGSAPRVTSVASRRTAACSAASRRYFAYSCVLSTDAGGRPSAGSSAVKSPSTASSSIVRSEGNPALVSPSFARLACASGSVVLFADSSSELGECVVIGTPSRTQRHRTSPAASPAFHTLHSASLALSLVWSPARCVASPGPSPAPVWPPTQPRKRTHSRSISRAIRGWSRYAMRGW